ncbi:MAG: flagellar motor protein MotB [Gemmatimonadaceae bacterium]|nr:flagellar motor protein MotB [Gemmatimonadaceae bacterium]
MAKGGGKVIIVKKIKKAGHGHHGGSWKVAYADFVTAMMAFFMVMWILGMDDQTKKAIEGYFSSPVGFKKGYSSGSSPLSSGSSPAAVKRESIQMALRQVQEKRFLAVQENLRSRIDSMALVGKLRAKVEVTVSRAGLRIELIEDEHGDTFFPISSAVMTEQGHLALNAIAQDLVNLENPVVIEGHTDAARYASASYTNWELSADRANAARRILETYGLKTDRIIEVTGLADKQLRYPTEPLNPSNRRISILLPFLNPPDAPSVDQLKEKIESAVRQQS